MQYVDASALAKVHLDEPDTDAADAILGSDPSWATARHTFVQVRRTLARLLSGEELRAARESFHRDWYRVRVIDLDEGVCERAAELAEATGVRTLDALHLGAADVFGPGSMPFVTFNRRLAEAARALGWEVRGA
ncbi:MAG TPA: type II toxin-antitoxin system VapC family toxin [Gaiellaceae bacterium]|nr:type II toxin-antitoxin system VapC family toxin [Gaiellaceae bacterium]